MNAGHQKARHAVACRAFCMLPVQGNEPTGSREERKRRSSTEGAPLGVSVDSRTGTSYSCQTSSYKRKIELLNLNCYL